MFTGSSDIFRLLLHGGASTNECNHYGQTVDVITAIWNCFFAGGNTSGWSYIPIEEINNFEHCMAITQLALDNGCVFGSAEDGLIAASPLFSMYAPNRNYEYASAPVDAINYLHSIGWNLEEQNYLGQTSLLHTAAECLPPVARSLKSLIERGARLDARDKTGRGPLHSALSPPRCVSDWVDIRNIFCNEEEDPDEDNNDGLSTIWNPENEWFNRIWNTEDHRYVEDYYYRHSTLDSLMTTIPPDPPRSTPSLDAVESAKLVGNPESNASAEQPTPIDLSSPVSDNDASSYAESISDIDDDDDDEYVYYASARSGKKSWIRNPVRVLKDRVRTKLKVLLDAGCDPNDLDYAGKSLNDYARDGLWPQWLWALERTGYVFDGEQDRWIKRIESTE